MDMVRRMEWYSLLLCVVSIPLFESPKTIFLVLAAVLFVLRRFGEKDFKRAFLSVDPRLGFLLLAASALASAGFAESPGVAVRGATDYLKMYMLFVIAAVDFGDARSVKRLAVSVVASTAAGSLWGIIEYPLIKGKPFELNSVGHFNHSSIYLATAALSALCLLNAARRPLERSFLASCSLLMLSALALTTSRATYIAFFAALAAMAAAEASLRRKAVYLLLVLCLILVPLLFVAKDAAFTLADKGLSLTSLETRLPQWELAWEVFKENPLVGVGSKHFQFQDPAAFGVHDFPYEAPSHPHNLYMSVLSQNGLLGVASLAVLVWLCIRSSMAPGGQRGLLRPAAVGALAIVLVNGLLNTTLHSEHGLLFSITLALGASSAGGGPSKDGHAGG